MLLENNAMTAVFLLNRMTLVLKSRNINHYRKIQALPSVKPAVNCVQIDVVSSIWSSASCSEILKVHLAVYHFVRAGFQIIFQCLSSFSLHVLLC